MIGLGRVLVQSSFDSSKYLKVGQCHGLEYTTKGKSLHLKGTIKALSLCLNAQCGDPNVFLFLFLLEFIGISCQR